MRGPHAWVKLALLLWLSCYFSIYWPQELTSWGFLSSTFVTAIIAAWGFVQLSLDDSADPLTTTIDPWLRIKDHKQKLFFAALTLIALATLLLNDVIFFGHSLISAPWFNLGAQNTPATAGFGHTVDPWAGFLIEGPGIFLTGAAFKLGEIPFWNPFEACGTPYAANGEMAPFSLLQLPLHLNPSLAGWNVFAIVRIIVGSLGGWLCSFALGRSSQASVLVGVGLGFSGVFLLFCNLVHINTALVIPFFVLTASCFAHHPTWKRWLVLVAIIALGFNGGNPQPMACALVIYMPCLLIRSPKSKMELVSILGGYCLAALFAASLSAFTLLPLADLLGKSENRTFFALEIIGTAGHLIDWFAPGGPIIGESIQGISGPPWWRLGAVPMMCAIIAAAMCLRKPDRSTVLISLSIVIFFCFALFPVVGKVFASLPVVGGLKWTKYVTIGQLLVLLLAAKAIDLEWIKEKPPGIISGIIATFLVIGHGIYFHQRLDNQFWQAIIPCLVITAFFLVKSIPRSAVALLPLLFVCEVAWHRPPYPEALTEISSPSGLPIGSDIQSPKWEPMEERTMAFRDAVAPLLSGIQGWYDIRSVGAFPLSDYHRLMAPYMNCGPWPPYMLLGASREIILSPYFDLAGVHKVVFRSGDFKDLVRERREDLLEDSSFVRFGEFQRALDYTSITGSNLSSPDAFQGSFLLLPTEAIQLRLNLSARSARIGLKFESPTGDDFQVTTGFGDDIRTIHDETENIFAIDNAEEPVTYTIGLKSKKPVLLFLTQWWVDRHIAKGRYDFLPEDTKESLARGLKILKNKYPLPLARVMYKGRLVPQVDMAKTLNRYVATGLGWDPRKSLLLHPNPQSSWDYKTEPQLTDLYGEQKAHLFRKGWNQMRVDVSNNKPGWLSLAVAYDPGWRAFIDNEEIPVVKANGAFMAMPLRTKGKQSIYLRYQPESFRMGSKISLISAAILAIFGLAKWIAEKRRIKLPQGRQLRSAP